MNEPEKRGITPAQGSIEIEKLIEKREACIGKYLMVTIGTQKECDLYDEIMELTDTITTV